MPEALAAAFPCGGCTGRADSVREWVRHLATMLLMLDGDLRPAAGRFTPYLVGADYGYNRARPGADIAAFGTGLAGREAGWMATTAPTRGTPNSKGSLRPPDWTRTCGACARPAVAPGSVEVYPGRSTPQRRGSQRDPPTGDGWRGCGRPSRRAHRSHRVFADREGLVDWLTSPAYLTARPSRCPGRALRVVVDAGWAPSGFASAATGFIAGEQVYRPSVGLITEPLPYPLRLPRRPTPGLRRRPAGDGVRPPHPACPGMAAATHRREQGSGPGMRAGAGTSKAGGGHDYHHQRRRVRVVRPRDLHVRVAGNGDER